MKKIQLTAILAFAVIVLGFQAHSATPYSQVVSNDAPALYWNFDETTGNAHEVIPLIPPTNINNLNPEGGATRVSHADIGDGFNLGNAGSFSLGVNGTCFLANSVTGVTNTISGPWMLEFWMQVQGSQQYQRDNYVMNFGNNAPAVLYDYVGAAQPRDGIELYSLHGRTGAGPVITDTNFHYILFVFYGDGTVGVTNRLDIYVDGTNAAQGVRGTFTSPLTLSGSVCVGDAASGDTGDAFTGNLDEVAAYNLAAVATNASQVTAIASLTASNHYAQAMAAYPAYRNSVLASGPTMYWDFDEAELTAPADQLAPINLGPVSNDLAAENGAGRISHAALQDGLLLGNAATFVKTSGEYYYTSDLNYFTNVIGPPWLLEFWMQAPDSDQVGQQDSYLWNFGPGGGNTPAILYDYVGGAQPRDGLEMFANGTRTGAGPIITDQNWHHVIFAYYGNGGSGLDDRMDIYVDGTNAVQYVQNTFTSDLTMRSQMIVGTSAPQFAPFDGFTGNLDELAIYDWSSMTNEADMTAMVTAMAARHFAAAIGSPPLSIGFVNGQIVVSWGASVNGFVLQSTTSLSNPSWSNVAASPTIASGIEQVAITPGTESQFFRLHFQ